MSFPFKLGSVASVIGSTAAAYNSLKAVTKRYPPSEQPLPINSEVEVDGQKKVVIGYTGHHAAAFRAIAQQKKDLYFGPAATAMHYAEKNGKATGNLPAAPTMGVVVADGPVHFVNLNAFQDGIVFRPVTPQQQKNLGVRVINLKPVTLENRVGVTGAFQRMKADMFSRGIKAVMKQLLSTSDT